jgi:hypothetical protein
MNAEDLEAVTAIWASGSSARTTYATQNPPQTPHRHTNPSEEPPMRHTRRTPHSSQPTGRSSGWVPGNRWSADHPPGNPRAANPRRNALEVSHQRAALPGFFGAGTACSVFQILCGTGHCAP